MLGRKDDLHKVAFKRITLVGSSGCGKTSLANAFVNNCCPARYIRTDTVYVYHKKIEMTEAGEWAEKQPILLEIEDTPGSERGFTDDGDSGAGAGPRDDGGPPTVRRGARVRVLPPSDKQQVLAMFNSEKYRGRLKYKPGMDGMLGKEFPVRSLGNDGSVGLPSPDGSEGGVWNFPPGCVKLKVSMDLPIDGFLDLAEKEPSLPKDYRTKKSYIADLQVPFKAYGRPIGGPEADRSLSRNRMAFMICFDISDESGDSLREAMSVYALFKKKMATKDTRLKPVIWLVGCKADRTAAHGAILVNDRSAADFSESEEIPYTVTSARNYQNTHYVFDEVVQAISGRESLWTLEGLDGLTEEETEGGCTVA
eukprot:TRINITY_DN47057_c0_g1_i1.p1 TRINITY_DN47057_c0_g1~~TRINITY_DN47057_c0_g1_i1.p1  ORF type:complete len:366 (-),score=76.73 TRINITY_DN47057_c0_g1_i1:141-1238(-)